MRSSVPSEFFRFFMGYKEIRLWQTDLEVPLILLERLLTVQDHLLRRSLLRSHRLLICKLRITSSICSLCCTRSFARSLAYSLLCPWESEWLEGFPSCVFFLFWTIVQWRWWWWRQWRRWHRSGDEVEEINSLFIKGGSTWKTRCRRAQSSHRRTQQNTQNSKLAKKPFSAFLFSRSLLSRCHRQLFLERIRPWKLGWEEGGDWRFAWWAVHRQTRIQTEIETVRVIVTCRLPEMLTPNTQTHKPR